MISGVPSTPAHSIMLKYNSGDADDDDDGGDDAGDASGGDDGGDVG